MTLTDATTTQADTGGGATGDDPGGDARPDLATIARTLGATLRADVAARDATGEISAGVFAELRTSGLTAALVPTEFGGGGATHAEVGAMLRELARHDGPTAVTLAMHSHVLALQVWRHHRGMDATGVFAKVVGGAVLCTTGASDWVASSGTVTRVEGGYRVSGRKGPVSGCEVANVLASSFRWEDAPDGPQVIHCSLPIAQEGVRIDHTWDTIGMRATGSHTVVLDDVFVPDAAVSLVRPADVWAPIWNVVLTCAMPLIMAAYLGVADEAVAIASDAASGRSDAVTTQLLGEMTNAHVTAADLVDAMLRESKDLRFDNTDITSSRTLSRKTVATAAMLDVVRLAGEIVGGQGFMRSSDMARLQRDILGTQYHPLPHAKQIHFSGRVAAGLSPVG